MTNKQAKSLMDVIKIMNENFYDFIGEDVKTIGSNGKRRTVLLFERQHKYGYVDNDNNKLQDSVNDINSKIDEEEKIKKDEVEVYQSWKKLKETLTEALSH